MAKTPAPPSFPVNPALEAAVIAHAEDDTPRLVYADWLDENGDHDRAEFIRTQVALWEKNPADDDHLDLEERLSEVCENIREHIHEREWAPKLPIGFDFVDYLPTNADDSYTGYHRGFPHLFKLEDEYEHGSAYPEMVREGCAQILQTTPIRGFVSIADVSNRVLSILLASPLGQSLTTFGHYSSPHDESDPDRIIPNLLGSETARNLSWLTLGYIRTTEDLEALATTKELRRLRRFHGGFCDEAKHLKRLMGSEWFARLGHLNTHCTPQNANAFAKGLAGMPELHTLEGIPTEAIAALPKAGKLRALARLRLVFPCS
jgi:uncharacterized protein (TIGR02996 family)